MTSIILMSIAIFILFIISAIASATEIALEKANKVRLNYQAENGNKKAIIAKKNCDEFSSSLTTILFTNNLVNIGATSLATLIAIELSNMFEKVTSEGAQTWSSVIITILLLLVGEVLPKIYATERADTFILFSSGPLKIARIIFKPVEKAADIIVRFINKVFAKKDDTPSVTSEELATIVEEIEEEGVISEKESELILNAIDFTDLTAQDILIPRVDVSAIDADEDISEILDDLDRLQYSRIPVYKDSMDNIIGTLSTKNFVRQYVAGEDIDIESMLQKPYFVHMTKSISSIFKEMKENRIKMAIVVDEYGGTMGIVTMEDILEEIFGEIYDENDIVEEDVIRKSDDDYIIDGSISIHDMFETLGYDDKDIETEYTTAGGWVMEKLDKIPEEGDSFEFENYIFKVNEMDGNRVEKIEVTILEKDDDEKE